MESKATDPPTILQVTGVSKNFGGVQAVRDFSMSVIAGGVTGLVGPNGAGKSTAIDLISGLLRPNAGTIKFGDIQIEGWPAHRVARLGLLRTFQLSREWASLTVMENLMVAALDQRRQAVWRALVARGGLRTAQSTDIARSREVLAAFGLSKLTNSPAGSLSGGQKRLLEFARIVMAQPRMVLLDEPFAGVNPVMATGVMAAISDLASRGITILLVEHNLGIVERLASVVVVMSEGHEIAKGRMQDLRSHAAVSDAYLGTAR